MKSKIRRVLLVVPGVSVLVILIVVGPWPTYSSTDVQREPYYAEALQRIDDAVEGQANGRATGSLMAGWGRAAAVPAMRRALHDVRSPRPSHEKATRKSWLPHMWIIGDTWPVQNCSRESHTLVRGGARALRRRARAAHSNRRPLAARGRSPDAAGRLGRERSARDGGGDSRPCDIPVSRGLATRFRRIAGSALRAGESLSRRQDTWGDHPLTLGLDAGARPAIAKDRQPARAGRARYPRRHAPAATRAGSAPCSFTCPFKSRGSTSLAGSGSLRRIASSR